MKRITYYLGILFVVVLLSCNNGENNKGYNPNRENNEVDSERQRQIANKKAEFDVANLSETELYKISDSLGTTKISVFLPQTNDISATEIKIIENKLVQILTINGVGGVGGTPRFILTPVITQTKQDITSTAPTMYSNTYDFTLYIADALQGSVFATSSISVSGVGQSPLKAFINAFENLNPKEKQFYDFVLKGKKNITDYYNNNCENIIKEAEKFVSKKQYNKALTILDAIPSNVNCYDEVVLKTKEIFQKLIDNDCELV